MVTVGTQPLFTHIQSVPQLLNTDPITSDYQEIHLYSGVTLSREMKLHPKLGKHYTWF